MPKLKTYTNEGWIEIGKDGKNGEMKDLNPEELRDLLELLEGDERLDLSAIRGITVSQSAPQNPKQNDIWIRA